jgi:hypothetical protein
MTFDDIRKALHGAIALLAASVAQPAGAEIEARQGWRPANGDRLVFDVFRDGSRFGSHIVHFTRNADELTVETDIELKVALGPITLFHYVHDATERWSAGALRSVSARTKKDGGWKTMTLEAVDGGQRIMGAGFKGILPDRVIPSTHWNVAQMSQSAMLSTETGALLPMTVTDRGLERVRVGDGAIEARRYDVKSEIAASLWYDAAGRWVKCAFEAQGSRIDYVLRKLPG